MLTEASIELSRCKHTGALAENMFALLTQGLTRRTNLELDCALAGDLQFDMTSMLPCLAMLGRYFHDTFFSVSKASLTGVSTKRQSPAPPNKRGVVPLSPTIASQPGNAACRVRKTEPDLSRATTAVSSLLNGTRPERAVKEVSRVVWSSFGQSPRQAGRTKH